ncbi:MAG: hypothetical protein D6758_01995 [Gammaproteobacteria bacterium]|nr:MAG: hypothetical protein D6758_01995 [Gammaproteobacteria bacterium]
MRTLLTATVAAVLLSACGFQLRGTQSSITLTDTAVYVECPDAVSRTLCQQVREGLRTAGADLVPADESRYELDVPRVVESIRAVSISQSADTAENEITRTVTWSVRPRHGNMMTRGDVHRSQTYRYDKDSVLGDANEQADIREDLDRQLAQAVVYQAARAIQSFARQNTDAY